MAGLVPAIHVLLSLRYSKTWMPAFAGMTEIRQRFFFAGFLAAFFFFSSAAGMIGSST
jgi:hypothetical protein